MKRYLWTSLICLLITGSCVKNPAPEQKPEVDIEHFSTAEAFEIPVKDGFIANVSSDGHVFAQAVSPFSVMVPKGADIKVTYTAVENAAASVKAPQDGNVLENKAKLFQVICFEDSRIGDYDYNDLVIHVKYQQQGNIFGFGVQPIALGSTKSIKLGCIVYKGDTQIFNDIILPDGKDCREQLFQGQQGFINTIGNTINQTVDGQQKGWGMYLGSTIRNWDISKYSGNGAMRVEWFIEVDGDLRLYALSTQYMNQSFDKENLPYGLVITDTGYTYLDQYGQVCGKDWFNYPREAQSLAKVYPAIWEWMTTRNTYTFRDIYDVADIPENAYPASNLRLYDVTDADVCNGKYRQN